MSDNPALLRVNKEYLAALRSLPLVERERLLEGNWAIKPVAGKVFRADWFKLLPPGPLSRAAEFGAVYLLQTPWTHSFINELVSFPDGAHDG